MSENFLISEFERTCRWFNSAGYCNGGIVYDAHTHKMVMLDELPLYCPICEGNGTILTKLGEQFMEMAWRRIQGKMYAAIREAIDKRDHD
jgi:hypothetical protein